MNAIRRFNFIPEVQVTMTRTPNCPIHRRPGLRRAALAAVATMALTLTGLPSTAAAAAGDPPAPAPRQSAPTSPPAAISSNDIKQSAPDLPVDEILRLNAAARGGKDAWRKIQTMVQIGRIERSNEVPGMSANSKRSAALTPDASKIVELRIEMARPNKMRYELTYQGATAIQAFNGTEGYTVQPGPSGAVARPFSNAQTRAAAEQLDLEGPLLNASAKGTEVTLEGVDSVRDRPAYKLSLKMKAGVTRHVWVDAQTFLDVKLDGTRQIGDRVWPIETFFGDYRKVGSVQVPYQIETAVGGVHTMESVKLVKVMLNTPLEDSLFTLPRAPQPASAATSPRSPPTLPN